MLFFLKSVKDYAGTYLHELSLNSSRIRPKQSGKTYFQINVGTSSLLDMISKQDWHSGNFRADDFIPEY